MQRKKSGSRIDIRLPLFWDTSKGGIFSMVSLVGACAGCKALRARTPPAVTCKKAKISCGLTARSVETTYIKRTPTKNGCSFYVVPLVGACAWRKALRARTPPAVTCKKAKISCGLTARSVETTYIKRTPTKNGCSFYVVPLVGLEPTRYRYHWILSPARLPISPQRHFRFATL